MNLYKEYVGFNVDELKNVKVVKLYDAQKEKAEYLLVDNIETDKILLTDKTGSMFQRDIKDFLGENKRFTMEIIA